MAFIARVLGHKFDQLPDRQGPTPAKTVMPYLQQKTNKKMIYVYICTCVYVHIYMTVSIWHLSNKIEESAEAEKRAEVHKSVDQFID